VFFGSIMSTLWIPLLLGTIGIIVRGTAFALRGQAETVGEARALGAMFAFSSVAVPFAFGAALGAIASDRVPVGNAAGEPWGSWLNPTGLTVGVLSVLTGAFLAAVFLAGDAVRAGLDDLERAFRQRALLSGVLTGALALGALLVLNSDAPRLYDGLTSGWGLVLVLASAVAGGGTVALVAARRHELARITASAAVACVTVGWAVALRPDLLPGLSLEEAAASDVVLTALLITVAIGMVLLVPAMWLLYRLALRGDLGGEFEPLDRGLRPRK
jgi:cytochrome bd ubiquinol oxidase subunit II